MKTKTQLLLLVALACGGLIFLGAISLFSLSRLGYALDASGDQGVRNGKILNASRLVHVNFERQVQEWKNLLIRGNAPQLYDKHLKGFGDKDEAVQARLKELKGMMGELGMDGAKADTLIQAHAELGKKYRDALGSFDKANSNAGHVVDKLVTGIDRPVSSGIDDLVDAIEKAAQVKVDALGNEGHQTAGSGKIALFVAIVAGLFVVAAVGGGIGRNVFSQLGGEPAEVADAAMKIAQGDLTARTHARPGDTASLLAAIDHMREGLRTTVREIAACAEGVAASAQALTTAAGQVAASTQAQAQSTASSAAAIEQFTVTIEHVADNARDASSHAVEAGKLAEEGNQSVEYATSQIMTVGDGVDRTTAGIQALSKEVEQIGNVAVVIKEVADQTNLLALNAAIEAARAGEQGRGFAVVADEVRKLAERTTNSVAEISTMISTIQTETRTAVISMQENRELASSVVSSAAGATGSMAQISYTTDSVVAAIGEVSNALSEQRSAATELARNIEAIAQMSEENSAAANAMAATSHEMEALSSKLNHAVSQFRF